MWSAITSTIAKDLGEFATVVGGDTKKLLGEEEEANLVAGDEKTDLGLQTRLEIEELLQFQKAESTYLEALTPSESKLVDDELSSKFLANSIPKLIDPLMEDSSLLQKMFEKLVTQQESVSSKVFFERYFLKLQLKRLQKFQLKLEEEQKAREEQQAQESARLELEGKAKDSHRRASNKKQKKSSAEENLDDWDDIAEDSTSDEDAEGDDEDENPSSVQEGEEGKTAAKSEESRRRRKEKEAAMAKKIQDLQRLVGALNAQIESLRTENDGLKAENRQLRTFKAQQQQAQQQREEAEEKEVGAQKQQHVDPQGRAPIGEAAGSPEGWPSPSSSGPTPAKHSYQQQSREQTPVKPSSPFSPGTATAKAAASPNEEEKTPAAAAPEAAKPQTHQQDEDDDDDDDWGTLV